MLLKDKIQIKTDSNGYYSKSGNYKSLRELYTKGKMNLIGKDYLVAFSNPALSSIIPSDLEVLEYVDATNQYILTHWYPDQTFGIEIKWSTTNTSNSVAQIFGGGGSAHNDRAFECYPWDGLLQLNFGSSSLNTLSVIANNIYTIRMMQRSVYVKNETNGAEYSSTHSSVTFKAPLRLCLFNINRTTGNSLAQYGRIYGCKIYKNSRVISDLIPCQTKSFNMKGFYDKATGWFYGFNGRNTNYFRGYYNVPSTSNTKMANSDYWIFPGSEADRMLDARVPIITDRFYKNNINYGLAHPKLLATMSSLYDRNNIASVNGYDQGHWDKLLTGSGTARWTVNEYGSTDGRIPPAGVMVCQGGGGGSGGADNNSDDTAGGGGGGGACTFIYYRIKKGNCNFYIQSGGGGGGAGAGAPATGGTGGGSKIQIADPNGNYVQINSDGGSGGNNQDTDYTVGGSGGCASANWITGGSYDGTKYSGGSVSQKAWGQGGGGSTNGNSAGGGYQSSNSGTIVDNEYIYAYCYYCVGGGGGCGGDDTGGSGVSIGSAGGVTGCTIYFPRIGPALTGSYTATWSNKSGGAHGWENNDATPGGGGASLWSNGGAGGPNGNNGNGWYVGYSGSLGSGAGGSAVADNADRGGAPGGPGFVWLWKY